MPAYWVAHARINDPVEYKKYTDQVPAIIKKYGGKVLARGGAYQINEGGDDFRQFHRHVVIEFPTMEQADRVLRVEGVSGRCGVPPRGWRRRRGQRRRRRRRRHQVNTGGQRLCLSGTHSRPRDAPAPSRLVDSTS